MNKKRVFLHISQIKKLIVQKERCDTMKIRNLRSLNGFIGAVSKCRGAVWLEAPNGTKYDLHSSFSQYLALGTLLLEQGDSLELFCSCKDDEHHFREFFLDAPIS